MLRDDVQHRLRQTQGAPKLQAILDVRHDEQGRHLRRQAVVHVFADLIFDKAVRAAQLADIVISPPTRHSNGSAPTALAAASLSCATISECV
jgi:uncharacterized protein YwlG (UPF0340 family)